MKKIIILFLILFLTHGNIWAEEKKVKLRIFWYAYEENKNKPISNINIYVEKNKKILWNEKTTKEGLYDMVIENRDDYLNLCIESWINSSIKWVKFCNVVSAFQWIWKIVDGVEIREISYDFYTNSSWENLNERYENEITNEDTEKAYDEYQENINEKREQNKIIEQEKIRAEEIEKQKAEYKMVANTEMSWPLPSIQIIGTVKSETGVLKPEKTYVQVFDHFWNLLKEENIDEEGKFNINIKPKWEPVFLHPVNFKALNREFNKINGEIIPLYNSEFRLITNEKNIINAELKKRKYTSYDKTINIRKGFPYISLLIIMFLFSTIIIVVIKNKINNLRQ